MHITPRSLSLSTERAAAWLASDGICLGSTTFVAAVAPPGSPMFGLGIPIGSNTGHR
jgi:hypothetical protein